MDPSDSDLLASARQGDDQAFAQLVDRHGPRLYRIAVSMVGDVHEAQDLLQETLTGVFVGMGGFRGHASVRTWMTRILIRQVARYRRRQGWRRRFRMWSTFLTPAGDEAGPEPAVPAGAQADAKMDLAAALAAIPVEYRDVLVLREIDGLSYGEIAQALHLPPGTVESRLHRGRQALRQWLQRQTHAKSVPSGPSTEKDHEPVS